MKKDWRPPWGLIVLAVVMAGTLGVCAAVCGDDDDEDGLRTYQVSGHRDGDGDDRRKGENSRGDCEGSTNCDERDFSPTFDDSPVVICVQPGACEFGDGEQTALFPPDPAKLVSTIQTGAEAIGKSAGAMAGAIAALPIGILL